MPYMIAVSLEMSDEPYFLDADDAEFSYFNPRHPRLSDSRYKFSNTEEENTSAMKQMLLFADML